MTEHKADFFNLQSQATTSGLVQASQLLRQALLADQARSIWKTYLPNNIDSATEVLSYRAIARAISDAENLKYGMTKTPGQYKDRVRRAILGQRLTGETLTIFSETFDFPPEVTQEISEALYAEYKSPQKPDPSHTHRPHFSITSSFYDIYLNQDLRVYRLDSSVVIRAKEEVDHVWAEKSDDVLNVEAVEGAQSTWVPDVGAWRFDLAYPLGPLDSIEVRYRTEVDASVVPQKGIIYMRYGLPRPACFYRIFFDQPEKAPKELTLSRYQRKAPDKLIASRDIPVFQGHASLYLDEVGQEILVFSAKDDA